MESEPFSEVDYLRVAEPARKADELIMKNLEMVRREVNRLLDKQRKGLLFSAGEDRLFKGAFEMILALWEVQDERGMGSLRYGNYYEVK